MFAILYISGKAIGDGFGRRMPGITIHADYSDKYRTYCFTTSPMGIIWRYVMSEFTGFGRTNHIDFGDYVHYPNGYSKELHIYKVVGSLQSNCYQNAPDTHQSENVLHNDVVDCLNIIHCGIDETKVIRVKESDCKVYQKCV
jgi:hypothetical protein